MLEINQELIITSRNSTNLSSSQTKGAFQIPLQFNKKPDFTKKITGSNLSTDR